VDITTLGLDDNQLHALRDAIDAHFTKPETPDELLAELLFVLDKQREKGQAYISVDMHQRIRACVNGDARPNPSPAPQKESN
jgi:DNA-binding response OmpR family regulator